MRERRQPEGSDSWWRGLQALLQGMTDCNPPGVLSKRFRTLTIPFPIDSFIIKSRPINLSQRTTKDLLWAEACFVLTDDRCFLLYTPLLACLSTSLVKKEYWDNWTYHSDGFSWVWPNFLLNTNILHFEQQWGKFSKGGDTDSLGLLFIRFYCRKESVLTMIIILIVFFICCNHGGD